MITNHQPGHNECKVIYERLKIQAQVQRTATGMFFSLKARRSVMSDCLLNLDLIPVKRWGSKYKS